MTATTLEQALRSSVFLLMDERRRLEQELMDMEQRMMVARTGAEAQTIQDQMTSHREALRELEAQAEAERQAERKAAAQAAAAAKRAALTGHSRMLADAHEAKLEALGRAESHLVAAVAAINDALQHEAGERRAAGAMAAEMNVETRPLNLNRDETVRRIVGGICSHLTQVTACRMRRLAFLVLPDHPHTRGPESWREREETATGPSVDMLLEHAQAQQSQH